MLPKIKVLSCGVVCIAIIATPVHSQVVPRATSDQARGSDSAIRESPDVRAHMRRVQDWFDETNDPNWYLIAFVATISEIRAINKSDKLIGELGAVENEVAVLNVRVVGRSNSDGLDAAAIIVCPTGQSRHRWERWKGEQKELLFQYQRTRKVQWIEKFGC